MTIPAAVRPASVAEQPLVNIRYSLFLDYSLHVFLFLCNYICECDIIISTSLEPWAQKAFLGTKTLNTIQSRVFPTAYHSFENMLVSVICVCALCNFESAVVFVNGVGWCWLWVFCCVFWLVGLSFK